MLRIVLGVAIAVVALIPSVGMSNDQQIADYIKSRLQIEQQQGNLRGFNVDMRVDQGTVRFTGHVSNEMQETTILQAAQQAGHLGVVQVVDDISVIAPDSEQSRPSVSPTQYQQSIDQSQNMAVAQSPRAPDYQTPYKETSIPNAQNPMIDTRTAISNGTPLPFAQAPGVPAMQASSPMVGSVGQMGAMGAPMPAQGMSGGFVGGGGGGGGYDAPSLPGYAWPGYAANPNYAAVTYPKQYSASAWPYIGPFYPYPQVPLGWRKVTLEWDDGWWMLDFHDK